MNAGGVGRATRVIRIPTDRLDRQLISRQRFSTPAEVVRWFGAMQAQDYLAARWALGLRTPGADQSTIETALTDGSVLRTHLFRFTWQYVAREDVRWMLALVGARVIASAASRFRQLSLDEAALGRCAELFVRALEGATHLTRAEMADVLTRGGVRDVGPRLSHILGHAELNGLLVSGGRRGKQQTFALLADRVPVMPEKTRDEALAELACRYLRSRGPATERDFAWWTGLPLGQARQAFALAGPSVVSERLDSVTYWMCEDGLVSRPSRRAYLLPAFDEYLVGYADRSAVIDPAHVRRVHPGGGMLGPTVVLDGRVIGTWKRALEAERVVIAIELFGRVTHRARGAVSAAATRHAEFLGLPAHIALRTGR